ncbi:hypothetical protein A3I51_04885 [Candidatus Gottesmanbacteria bacterium RIFCSPLOWO2_02_FULL_38_8]|uniref:Phosphoglycerate mutase n=1 Tax=Candidatus Gottesmanbacteria bacterium RIFCSPLOWO2_02_FULL_38_8 TaxID=1798397 RepID=A0A1F6B1V2_9BACT|nr:MAG: hypothetical protein A3I51_04885 [Candidatus Gottesmanbacteria bacterium RIFCSPLOWO2_02_FULL_38_8]
MAKTILIFLRHGQVSNDRQIVYGRLPGFGLSAQGREEVKQATALLAKYKIHKIYASPLLRTRQTAQILAKKFKIKPVFSRLLLEVNLIYQGMPILEFKSQIQAHLYDPANILKGQESIETISKRMSRYVNMVKQKYPGKIILAVSHGDPIVILKATTTGKKFTWEFKRDNYLSTAGWLIMIIDNEKFIWQ